MSDNICKPDDLYTDFKVSDNFWFSELIHSETANRNKIDNYPYDKTIYNNLIESCKNLFQPTRNLLNKPISVSCAYRCEKVNTAVGGAKNSAHKYGFAMDFKSPSFGTPYQIAKFLESELKNKGIKFDQLILEFNSWVHIAYKSPTGEQRGQLLTAKTIKGKTQYLIGIQQ